MTGSSQPTKVKFSLSQWTEEYLFLGDSAFYVVVVDLA